MKPVALIDLDGTVADYHAQITADLQLMLPPEFRHFTELDAETRPWLKNVCRMIKSQPGWWANLHPIQEGLDLVADIRNLGFRICVLTRGPSYNPAAWGEKRAWCQQYMPGAKVTITEDKSLSYGRVLVDDWPEYVEAWLARRPRGTVIMPDRPWNQGFQHDQVVRYDHMDAISRFRVHNALVLQLNRKDGEAP